VTNWAYKITSYWAENQCFVGQAFQPFNSYNLDSVFLQKKNRDYSQSSIIASRRG